MPNSVGTVARACFGRIGLVNLCTYHAQQEWHNGTGSVMAILEPIGRPSQSVDLLAMELEVGGSNLSGRKGLIFRICQMGTRFGGVNAPMHWPRVVPTRKGGSKPQAKPGWPLLEGVRHTLRSAPSLRNGNAKFIHSLSCPSVMAWWHKMKFLVPPSNV